MELHGCNLYRVRVSRCSAHVLSKANLAKSVLSTNATPVNLDHVALESDERVVNPLAGDSLVGTPRHLLVLQGISKMMIVMQRPLSNSPQSRQNAWLIMHLDRRFEAWASHHELRVQVQTKSWLGKR